MSFKTRFKRNAKGFHLSYLKSKEKENSPTDLKWFDG